MTTGVPMPDREYTNTAQLVVVAPDPATASALLEQAVTAIIATLDQTAVRLLTEKENGMFVFSPISTKRRRPCAVRSGKLIARRRGPAR